MKVILLRDVAKVGRRFEVKEVASGYGRNFLLNQGLALSATPENLARLKCLNNQQAGKEDAKRTLVEEARQVLTGKTITLSAKANDVGQLFAAIARSAVVEAIKKQTGLTIEPEWVSWSQPLKKTGEHEISVARGTDTFPLKLTINAA